MAVAAVAGRAAGGAVAAAAAAWPSLIFHVRLNVVYCPVFDAVVHYFSLMSLSMIQEVVHVV